MGGGEVRVLAFNWRDRSHPQAGGAEKNIHEFGKRMVESGHEFVLVCGMYQGASREETMDGFRVVRGGGSFSVYLAAPLMYMRERRVFRPDIIIDDINGIPFFTPIFTRRPRVGLFHHRVGDIFKRELPFPLSRLGMFLEEHLLPLLYTGTEMVTVSDSSRSELVDLGFPHERIHIIYNGVDTRTYTPSMGVKTEAPSICYVGRLKRYKRVEILLRAVKGLTDEFPDLMLRIAGKGDDRERLEGLVRDLGIEDHVEFMGFVSTEEKLDLLRSSWAFAMPSVKEGWGITGLEANACGTPVVAFDVPGLRDSVSRGVSGLLAVDENGFADAMASILRDEELRSQLSVGAREWSLQFDWDASAVKLMGVLERVRDNGHSRALECTQAAMGDGTI
jgi:glycosyltransferase involved in cell wall biosynthesis